MYIKSNEAIHSKHSHIVHLLTISRTDVDIEVVRFDDAINPTSD